MTVSQDLLLAILSLDSYNQGFGHGVKHGKNKTGTVIKQYESDAEVTAQESLAAGAGVYAISYDMPHGRVISYRGTDDPSDI